MRLPQTLLQACAIIAMSAVADIACWRYCMLETHAIWPPNHAHANTQPRLGADMRQILEDNLLDVATAIPGRYNPALAAIKNAGLRAELSALQLLQPELFSHSLFCLLHQALLRTVRTHLYMEYELMSDFQRGQFDTKMRTLTNAHVIHSVRTIDRKGFAITYLT
jgi:hypothetical protein